MQGKAAVAANSSFLLFNPLMDVLESWLSCIYKFVQIAGIFVFAFGIALIEFCVLTVVRIALPILTEPGSLAFVLLFAFTCVVSFGILFNFIAAAVFRSPPVDSAETERLAREGEELSKAQQRRLLDAPARFCRVCCRFKAPREHHCRVCNRCVAKMDHHCPWINNCVDAENHRYFFLFVSYLLVGTCAGVAVLGPPCVRPAATVSAKATERGVAPYRTHTYRLGGVPVTLTLTLCGVIFCVMIFFFALNIVHILRNETQLERFAVKTRERLLRGSVVPFRNPYDLGRWRNFLEFLHTKGDPFIEQCKKCTHISAWRKVLMVVWLVIPTLRHSACDGVHYPTFDQEVMAP